MIRLQGDLMIDGWITAFDVTGVLGRETDSAPSSLLSGHFCRDLCYCILLSLSMKIPSQNDPSSCSVQPTSFPFYEETKPKAVSCDNKHFGIFSITTKSK